MFPLKLTSLQCFGIDSVFMDQCVQHKVPVNIYWEMEPVKKIKQYTRIYLSIHSREYNYIVIKKLSVNCEKLKMCLKGS